MEQSSVGVDKKEGKKKREGRPDTSLLNFLFEFPFLFRSGPLVGTSKVRWRFSFSVFFCAGQGAPFSSWFSRLVESFHCACAMSFSDEEVLNALEGIPSDGFLAESAEVRTKWLHFVASVDPDPKNLHDVMFYAIVARTLAEVRGVSSACRLCRTTHALADCRWHQGRCCTFRQTI